MSIPDQSYEQVGYYPLGWSEDSDVVLTENGIPVFPSYPQDRLDARIPSMDVEMYLTLRRNIIMYLSYLPLITRNAYSRYLFGCDYDHIPFFMNFSQFNRMYLRSIDLIHYYNSPSIMDYISMFLFGVGYTSIPRVHYHNGYAVGNPYSFSSVPHRVSIPFAPILNPLEYHPRGWYPNSQFGYSKPYKRVMPPPPARPIVVVHPRSPPRDHHHYQTSPVVTSHHSSPAVRPRSPSPPRNVHPTPPSSTTIMTVPFSPRNSSASPSSPIRYPSPSRSPLLPSRSPSYSSRIQSPSASQSPIRYPSPSRSPLLPSRSPSSSEHHHSAFDHSKYSSPAGIPSPRGSSMHKSRSHNHR